MLKKTASKWPVPGPPASDARSDATLSHPPVASGLVPDENLMFSHTLLQKSSRPPAAMAAGGPAKAAAIPFLKAPGRDCFVRQPADSQ